MATLVIRVRDLYFWPDDITIQAGQRAVYQLLVDEICSTSSPWSN